MGLSGGGGDGGAAQARADEQERQAHIRQGTEDINKLFDGYSNTHGDGLVDPANYVAGTTYYDDAGKEFVYNPPPAPASPGATPVFDPYANGNPDGKTANINPGGTGTRPYDIPKALYSSVKTDTVPGQFSDDFFSGRQKSYLDYATPQLNDQYEKAKKDLVFSLDRSGLTDSSVRASKEADLQKLYDQNRQQVADKALSYQTDARNNIENARADLIATLNATGDAQGAVNSAITRAKALSAPDTYDPLAQMFVSFTSGLGQQAAAEKAAALANSYTSSNSAGLFGSNKKSVTTTG